MSTSEDIKLASKFGNLLAYEPNSVVPVGYELVRNLTVDDASGLKLSTYYNATTRKVVVAVAGTTGLDDVNAYPSLYLGYLSNKSQIDVATNYFDRIRAFANQSNASVLVSGHSFAGLFVDIGAAKFGFRGIKFDGVGGGYVVNDDAYQRLLNSLGIQTTSGGSVTSVGVNGFLGKVVGGGLVEYFGRDIPGTTYCQVTTTRGVVSGVANLLSILGGWSAFLYVKFAAAGYSHNAVSINAALQEDQFTCTWGAPASPASTSQTSTTLDVNKLLNLDKQIQKLFDMKVFSQEIWKSYTKWSTSQLITAGGPGINLNNYPTGGPGIKLNPIGAFYESRTPANDPALAISSATFRILDSNGQAMAVSQLTALDRNNDGQLSGSELDNLYAWSDLNENGVQEQGSGAGNERRSLRQALSDAGLSALRAHDYAFYSRGNGTALSSGIANATSPKQRPAAAPVNPHSAPGVPAAQTVDFDAIRRANPVYFINSHQYVAWDVNQVAISIDGDKLIGTNGDDSFDINYYASWGYYRPALIQTFYAGGGNDRMGGSSRSDKLWGGTGNDTLWGYEGNDTMYGEDGTDYLLGGAGHDVLHGGLGNDWLDGQADNDVLVAGDGDDTMDGGDGHDQLDGGIGNDRMFGGAGNDTLVGGSGNDVMVGFTASDDAKQMLAAGESDHDVMLGGDGMDSMYGGLGNDFLDGGADADDMYGGEGNDTLLGAAGNDEMEGGDGHDSLSGGVGNDWMSGDVGNDQLWGGDGNDTMVGFTPSNSAKRSLSSGETDNDTMDGGAGNDVMYGGLGDDQIWGGTGDDTLYGGDGLDALYGEEGDDLLFGGAGVDQVWGGLGNDEVQGGAGNDSLYGEEGDDLLFGDFGNDTMLGGLGDDELQGGAGDDAMYGDAGNDRFFGGVGNDTIYGGEGNDTIIGFTASNETKQTLDVGESDDDFLYGGAGSDTVLGGLGNDYIDGGAGADSMEGGQGNDVYIVNSVNDVVLEQHNEGYDTVISSANYILNANIEELRLVEGYNIHATGNSLNNRLVGNSRDNILDGVTGADTMLGGLGDDVYYVDNAGDVVVEYAGEGSDTVFASRSYTLGEHIENLTLLDFAKPEKGFVDDVEVLVYGYPKAFELDYMQGNAVQRYKGTCALASIANLATQAGLGLSETDVVNKAIDNSLCVTDPAMDDERRGGTTATQQQALLTSYGIRNSILNGYNAQAIANLIAGGRGVIVGLDSGRLWGDVETGSGGIDHAITVTGAVRDAKTGTLLGFYIADSGRGKVSDMTRYVSLTDFNHAANVANAYAIYTLEPIKLWSEDIDASGNALDNTLVGNRGNNVLTGNQGNDVLVGMAGDDTYVFHRGDGQDTVRDSDSTLGNTDVLQLNGIDQTNLWFTQSGNDLQISIMGSADLIKIKDWYAAGSSDNQIERIKTADGRVMYNTDVDKLVQAMSAFGVPAAGQTSWTSGQTSWTSGQTSWTSGQTSNGQVLLAVTH